jgi:hypothetical protein
VNWIYLIVLPIPKVLDLIVRLVLQFREIEGGTVDIRIGIQDMAARITVDDLKAKLIEQRRVSLEMDDTTRFEDAAIPLEEWSCHQATGDLAFEGVRKSDPDGGDLFRSKKAVYKFDPGAEEGYIAHPGLQGGACTLPHPRAPLMSTPI